MAKILICDDAVFMRMAIKEILEGAGYEVVAEADDPEGALDIYIKEKPDLVMMDILMKTSGVEGVKKIIEFDPKAKIVIVTVLDEQEGDVVKAIQAGAASSHFEYVDNRLRIYRRSEQSNSDSTSNQKLSQDDIDKIVSEMLEK